MRIGIWGGSFNPPTLAHKAMADEAFKLLQLDEMWWIVAPHNPLKDIATLAPFENRMEMVKLVLAPGSSMKASDLEQRLKSSITTNTLSHIRADYPEDSIFLLMGMDNWETLHLWGDDHPQLFGYASIAVFKRPGYSGFEKAPATLEFADKRVMSADEIKKSGSWYLMDNVQMDVAATRIRKSLSQGEIPDSIDPVVLDYIRQKGLYK